MKRIFTLLFAVLTATTIMAQMHGPMKFVGASNMTVSTMSNDNPSDTILFAMNGMASGNITLPAMKCMKTIPSFTISGAKFTLGEKPCRYVCRPDFQRKGDSGRRGEEHHRHIAFGHIQHG